MRDRRKPLSPLPTELPVLAVLGLENPEHGDWERLRGLQYGSLGRTTRARLVIQLFTGLATAAIFLREVSHVALLCWLLALGASLFHISRVDRLLSQGDRRRLSQREANVQGLSSTINALVWVVPVAIFGYMVDGATQLKMWAVLAMLMSASVILLPAVPLCTLLLTGIVGSTAMVYFLFNALFDMAVICTAFLSLLFVGAIDNARRFLITRIAEAGMVEKSEVVSLLLREFEEGEADWLWEIDANRRVRMVSPRFAFALGKTAREIEGQSFLQLIAGESWETGEFDGTLRLLAERFKRRENFSNLLVRVAIDGQARWWELSGKPRLDEDGVFEGFRGVGSDVTEAREHSDKIAYLARYDTLTGLPNRLMLTEALGDALNYADKWRTRCAFLMIDLDRFKAVNDTLGHLIGDQLLARVSERLKEQETQNEICGRLGGDEFAIVVRDASNLNHVNAVADRVIKRLSEPYEVDHHTLFVGASIGSAIGPRDGATVETLMRNADLALYRSKDEGGGSHFTYEPSLHAHAEERRQLELSLRHAMAREEFVLNYQPVVSADTQGLIGFEALLRWNSKDHGSVSPAKFIPLAEDTRQIVPLGQWVLDQACLQARQWPDHVRVAVNVSAEQLLDPGFAASVVGALSSSGLPPSRLELEVTESIFLRDAALARAALEQVMGLGCGVALDDFGTGYSSLGYLRKLRFSTIKVDRTFVQGAATGNRESLAIIRAVVAMAESLEMTTTAEGVETEHELATIRKLGCDKIQGFLFGRPMLAEDTMKLFRNRAYGAGATAA